MLSYRHSFHAGNHADVLKHLVLVEILHYMSGKDTPLAYVDTHSGGGIYQLADGGTGRRPEYLDGISRLDRGMAPEIDRYLDLVSAFNSTSELTCYPGSPALALSLLRPQDKAWFFELHRNEVDILRQNLPRCRGVNVRCEDGFNGAVGLMPPASRRGLVLIDPPYEIKNDYDRVVTALVNLHRRFATGVFAIWYPVVERERIDRLERQLQNSGVAKIQLFELSVAADSPGRGMTGSGMVVVNPPWLLTETMQRLLPVLSESLAQVPGAGFRCKELA